MRPVRILLVAIAVLAVGLAGFALGARDDYRPPAVADQAATGQPAADQAATDRPAAGQADPGTKGGQPTGGGKTDPVPPGSDDYDRDDPAAKPRILAFGSEPVLPRQGGFWQLPAGPGTLTLVADARYASKVEFLLTPTGTGTEDLAVRIGQDTDGRDGYVVNWYYKDQPLLAHLTVRATGPGGTAERSVGVYHPDPAP